MIKKFNTKFDGFTLIETIIALSIFSILFLSIQALLQNMSSSVLNMQRTLQSELLAQNGVMITEEIIKNEDISLWDGNGGAEDRLKYIKDSVDTNIGESAETGFFQIIWDGSKYSLLQTHNMEGPINIYSEDATNDLKKFYRRIIITQKETWGLYEIEADVCYNECESHRKVYKIIEKKYKS